MYENRLETIVNIIEQQNNNYIEYKPREQLPKPIKIIEVRTIDDEIIIKTRNKDRKKGHRPEKILQRIGKTNKRKMQKRLHPSHRRGR